MKLHNSTDEFRAAILGAARQFQVQEHIIEKDYWVTMLLKKISEFEYKDFVIFKGGTSLSKGFGLLKRFSEDIDLGLKSEAISDTAIHKKSGEAIHKVINKLKISEFNAINEMKESEKQRYKRVYEFPKLFEYPSTSPIHGQIVLEVNAFSNPIPYEKVNITSLVGQSIALQFGLSFQEEAGLTGFYLNALTPERTFCEKLLAIRLASSKGIDVLKHKVRHLYDIHHLYILDRVKSFIEKDDEFEKMLCLVHKDDLLNNKISITVSNRFIDYDIFSNPELCLKSISLSYDNLRSITFDGNLPSESSITKTLNSIRYRLRNFEF